MHGRPTCRPSRRQLIISNWPALHRPAARSRRPPSQVFQDQHRHHASTTPTTSTTTPSSTPRCSNQLGACEPINRDMMMLTDWMAARMIGLGWIQPLDKAKVPNLHANLIEPLRSRQWDPDLQFHAPWQSGLTGIAYNAAEDRRGQELRASCSPAPTSRAGSRCSRRCATRWGSCSRSSGPTPSDFTDDEWERRDRPAAAGGRRRPGPGLHRQRVHPGPRGREHRRLRGVVGRRDPGPVRQPGHQVRGARGGAVALERQHDRPEPRDPPGQRRGVDRLLLRARGRGEARRLGQLHLPRRGRPRGDGEDRPVPGRQQADLPRRGDARRRRSTSCRWTTSRQIEYEGEWSDVTGG